MIALVTGASSGIGEELAKNLAKRGFNLIIAARREERLKELKKLITEKYDVKVKTLTCDLSSEKQCRKLYETVRRLNIDILINNAGFGLFGKFAETDLDVELKMIDVNIKAVHILTKLFLKDFRRRNYGYILNVSSIAGFLAGPLMAAYYASKNYVLQLTRAIGEELKEEGVKGVYVGALCPGPVRTEFNKVAGSEFAIGGASAAKTAEYALDQMFKRQTVIIPQNGIKLISFLSKVTPSKLLLKGTYFTQTARRGDPSDK